MPIPLVVARLIAWLREGYPEGVPDRDYLPLFALLARRLSHDELTEVVADLNRSGQLSSGEDPDLVVRRAIESVTKAPPSPEDVARVERRLNAVGWAADTATPS
jgi:hypothetical protein